MSATEFVCQCGWRGYPAFEMLMDGRAPRMVAKCCKEDCGAINPSLGPADFNTQIGNVGGREGVSTVLNADAAPPPIPPRAMPRAPVAATHAATYAAPIPNIEQAIRDRRDFLEMRVAEGEAAKVELRRLTRMLRAAAREDAVRTLSTTQAAQATRDH